MVYEVISPRGRGTGTIVGVHTESPQCIDSLDMQKAMVAGGSKITFEGTEEEYADILSGHQPYQRPNWSIPQRNLPQSGVQAVVLWAYAQRCKQADVQAQSAV